MYLATEIEFDLSLNSWCHDLAVEGCGVSGPDVALPSPFLSSHCLWISDHDQLHPPGFTPRKVMQRFDLDLTKYMTLYFRQSAPCKMVRYDAA